MEVVVRHYDIALTRGYAFDVSAPLSGDLDTALHRFRAAVHRQDHVLAAEFGERLAEGAEPVGVERAAHQCQAVQLCVGHGGDLRIAVTEVDGGVGRQTIEIATTLDIGHPHAVGTGGDDRQRRVVVRNVAAVHCDRRFGAAHGVDNGHGCTSNVQHLTDPPPLSSSDRSIPMGRKPAVRSCSANPVAAAGNTTLRPSDTALRPRT